MSNVSIGNKLQADNLTTCLFCIICSRSKVFSSLFQGFLKVIRIWHNSYSANNLVA